MRRVALYLRVSTVDQNADTQLHDLKQLAGQRGLKIVGQYRDQGVSGARARRPALDQMMADARRGKFDVVAVWASDRLARSTRHFLEVLDELHHLGVEYMSFREGLSTDGALGRAIMTIVGAVAELERSLIIERVRAGMRRAKLEGRHIGRKPLAIDRQAILHGRAQGRSLSQLAQLHGISRTSVGRVLRQPNHNGVEV